MDRAREIPIALSMGLPSIACAKYLEFVTDTEIPNLKKITHPMIYLRIAAKSANIFEKTDSEGDAIVENELIDDETDESN